jgi:(R,R)-butanediol dehydrogenase/meso-butanediol dehydrogenase/diacetyl reductase
MKAIRWHQRRDVRIDEIEPPPAPGPGEVQIEVLACGICGTDTEEYLHGPMFIRAREPHPLTGRMAPIVLGHEISGRVIAAGDGAGSSLVGGLVAVDGLISCGHCLACQSHLVNRCEQLASVGFSADGGLAPLLNAPARGCVPLPPHVDADAGALAETLSVGVHALRRARFEVGQEVVSFGGGAVGLLAVQAARALGAGRVSIVEPDPGRRDLARLLGIEAADPAEAVGLRADVVLECSGAAGVLVAALGVARPGGRVVMLAITTAEPPVPARDIVWGEREVIGSLSHIYDEDLPAAVELLAGGTVQTAPLVDTTDDLQAALDRLTGRAPAPGRAVKLVVHPPGS